MLLRHYSNLILLLIIIFSYSTSCKNHETDENVQLPPHTTKKQMPAVCIWDGINIREAPTLNSRAFSNLSLGESVTFLGISKEDSVKKGLIYDHIELSDGTTGWVAEWALVKDARTAVVTDTTSIYKRPDLLTFTAQHFNPMNIIAINNKKDQWIKVTGERKRLYGWIEMNNVSSDKTDIALALLTTRKLKNKKDQPVYEIIDDILKNNPYPASLFVETLKHFSRKEKENARLEEKDKHSRD